MSGLEALGVAAAVIQVADTGLRLSQNIYKYVDSVKSADSRLAGFAQDVNRTAYIVRDVGELFNEPAAKFVAPSGIKTARDCVGDCEDAFKEITAFVEHAGKNKWKFPYREQKLKVLDARLEKLKSNLTLILMVLSRSRDLKEAVGRKDHSQPKDDELLKEVASLKSASQLASTRYETLQKSFEKLALIITDGQETTEELPERLGIQNAERKITLNVNAEVVAQTEAARNEDTRFSSQHSKGLDLDEPSKSFSYHPFLVGRPQVALKATSSSAEDERSNVIPLSVHQDPNAAYVEGNISPNITKLATRSFDNTNARVVIADSDFKPGSSFPVATPSFRRFSDAGSDTYRTSKLPPLALSRASIETVGYRLNCIQRDLEELTVHVQALEETLESCSREMLTKVEANGLRVLVENPTKSLERLKDLLESSVSSANFQFQKEGNKRRFFSDREVSIPNGRDFWSDQRRRMRSARSINSHSRERLVESSYYGDTEFPTQLETRGAATDTKSVVTVIEQDDQEYEPADTVAGAAAAAARIIDQNKTPERPVKGKGLEEANQLKTEKQAWELNTTEKVDDEMRKKLHKFGFQDSQIQAILDPKKVEKLQAGQSPLPPGPIPNYFRFHRNHIDVETLRYYSLPWEYDYDNHNYIVILQEMTMEETEILFEHTRKLRRGGNHLLIEERGRQHHESQYAFVRRRKPSPESGNRRKQVVEFGIFGSSPERDNETSGTKSSSETPEETRPGTSVSDELPTAVYDEVEGLLRDWTTVFD